MNVDVSEARFTAPSVWCPNPQWWTAADEHSTELEVSEFLAGLVRVAQPELCVETGAAFGQTAEAIGQALLRNRHGRLITLEVDGERVETARGRCRGLPVDVVEMSSLEWTPDGDVDFAFFDSLFPLRIPEFLWLRPFMSWGAVVVFHDTAPLHGGGQFPHGRDLRGHLEAELGDVVSFVHLRTPRGLTIGEVR